MFLACDIGNTRIKSAAFENNIIKEISSFKNIEALINFYADKEIKYAAVSSVVPALTKSLSELLQLQLDITPYIVNYLGKFNLINEYKTPATLGIDRLCSAEGAFNLFKHSKNFSNYSDKDFIITIDLGTATTINFVKYPGVFLGGIIAPGIKTMFKSLQKNTAQLPSVEINDYENFIGADTKQSIASGVLNSTLGLIEKTISYIKQNYKAKNIFIYATGGNANEILKQINFEYVYDESLVLLGVKSVWELNH